MTREDIHRLEAEFRISLPEPYRSAHEAFDSLVLESGVEADCVEDVAAWAFMRNVEQVMAENRRVRAKTRQNSRNPISSWQENLLIVGATGCGDYWCLDLHSASGVVRLFNHETGLLEIEGRSPDDHIRESLRGSAAASAWAREEQEREELERAAAREWLDTHSVDELACKVSGGDETSLRAIPFALPVTFQALFPALISAAQEGITRDDWEPALYLAQLWEERIEAGEFEFSSPDDELAALCSRLRKSWHDADLKAKDPLRYETYNNLPTRLKRIENRLLGKDPFAR